MSKIIHLEGTFNTRDIGGIVNKYGKRIRFGLMIRSDALNALTLKDIQYFQKIGLKTIVDFRMKKEINVAPNQIIAGVKTFNLSPNAEVAALASGNIVNDKEKINALIDDVSTAEGKEKLLSKVDEMEDAMREMVRDSYANKQYTQFLKLLTDRNNLPLLHHCKGGKDRTGFGALITLLTLDVDIDKIREEYMLTKECMAKRNEKRMEEYREYTDNETVLTYLSGLMQTKELYFDAAIDEMIQLSGSVDKYLEEYLDLTSEKKKKINEIFLEG